MTNRKPYPTDVSDEEWTFVAPYLALVREDSPQRVHDLREVFDALRWIVRTGASWCMLPHDFPPWETVYQQTRRWLKAGIFEQMVHDLRALLRLASGRAPDPTAAVLDSRTLRSTPESGHRAGYDGAKRKKGSKVHAAVDTMGHLLALSVTPATEQDRAHSGIMEVDKGEKRRECAHSAYVHHQPEAAYFTDVEGTRGGFLVVDMDDASRIPAITEPLFLGVGATVHMQPAMTAEDLQGAAGEALQQMAQKYG